MTSNADLVQLEEIKEVKRTRPQSAKMLLKGVKKIRKSVNEDVVNHSELDSNYGSKRANNDTRDIKTAESVFTRNKKRI